MLFVWQRYPYWALQRQLVAAVNAGMPSRSFANVKEAGLISSSQSLALIEQADVYVALSGDTLKPALTDILSDQVNSVTDIQVELGEQEVITQGRFTRTISEHRLRVEGLATIRTVPTVVDGELVLTPVFSSIQLTRASIGDLVEVTALMPLINPVLAQVLDGLSGRLATFRIPVPVSVIKTLGPTDVLSNQSFKDLAGDPITLAAAIGAAAVLIEPAALHILADAVPLGEPTYRTVIDSFAKRLPDANTRLSSAQTAVLSQCDKKFELHNDKERRDYAEFQEACKRVREARKVEGRGARIEGIQSYSQFANDFKRRASEVGPLDETSWGRPGVSVAKRVVADVINEVAGDPHYRGSYRPSNITFAIDREIKSEPAPDLKCDDIGCNPNFGECVPTWSCGGRGCPSDCAWYDGVCHAWKPACEAIKAGERLTCEADKSRFQLMCNAGKEAEKLECEARKTGCKANQTFLNLWSEKPLGGLTGNAEIRDLAVPFELKRLTITPTLNQFIADASLTARANVRASLKFVPHDLGNLACVSQWSGDVDAEIKVEPFDISLVSSLASTKIEKNELALSFATAETPIQLKVNPSPFQAVLDHNPNLYVACAGGVIGKIFGAGTRDTFEYVVPAQTVALSIKQMPFPVAGNTIYLNPTWREHVIYFTPESPRWKFFQ